MPLAEKFQEGWVNVQQPTKPTKPPTKPAKPRKRRRLVKVLICGDRNYKERYAHELKKLMRQLVYEHGTKDLLIIEGGAPGVDSLAGRAAHKANVHVAVVNALWETRRNGAGPQRNEIMALLDPFWCYAIHEDISESVGTARMLQICHEYGIPYTLIGDVSGGFIPA